MRFSFWRSRNRFSLDELRYLTDQLQKIQVVNEVNKDFVIEALRSIAELITYGDQHDSNFFDFFMEKQVMGEFVRILKISRIVAVPLQLLQTMSIMIQNLKTEHAIYYMFSNEHINFLITYSFDFRNEELLSYYISFLRAISGKLDQSTISLLVKTQNEEVVSFPLYVEAIRFAFHEENMVRTAVRALTLNVYHVGDEAVNKFVTKAPHCDYFPHLVAFFRKQCVDLNGLVSETLGSRGTDATKVFSAIDDIEDNLYYFSDVISAGIPDVGRLITDSILQLLILPIILPSFWTHALNEIQISAVTSLFLLCCILRIVKIRDLANIVVAAFFCSPKVFMPNSEAKLNGYSSNHDVVKESKESGNDNLTDFTRELRVTIPNSSSSMESQSEDATNNNCSILRLTLRDALLSFIMRGDDQEVLGSLSLLATLLQTKELDETMLDAIGVLPQRKQHKRLLLQALVGEDSGEEQLFSSESSSTRDDFSTELDCYLRNLKERYGGGWSFSVVGTSPRLHRCQVLDSLVNLFRRSDLSAETLWVGGWLLRQLLPHTKAEFNFQHLGFLKESYKNCTIALLGETKGIWSDLLVGKLCDEWKKCKRAIEASSPPRDPKCIFLPSQKLHGDEIHPSGSSLIAGRRMCELVKVFVLHHQLQIFSTGRTLPEQPLIKTASSIPEKSRARTAGLDALGPKPGNELKIVDAVPCRIAFERGKERHFSFLAVSMGSSGWIILAEELPLKQHCGVVRITAPLAGSTPRIDEKHLRWLHLRIRPSTLPSLEAKSVVPGEGKTKAMVDGRWTLAFRDEESCKRALSMILEEIDLQSSEVRRSLKPLVDFERDIDVRPTLDSSSSSSSSLRSVQFPLDVV